MYCLYVKFSGCRSLRRPARQISGALLESTLKYYKQELQVLVFTIIFLFRTKTEEQVINSISQS